MINLPDTILASMRAAAQSLMTESCTIEEAANVVGTMGEVISDQYTIVATGVACRVLMLGRRYSETSGNVGERETITEAYRLIVPYGTALAVDQRVTLSDGTKYQIVDLNTARTSETDAQAVMVRIHG